MEKSLINYKKGDVVVVDFLFSDASESKRRPALIISTVRKNSYILCQITSKFSVDEYAVFLSSEDFVSGNLDQDSFVKINFISTIDSGLIIKKIGSLKKEKITKIIDEVTSYLNKY